MTTKQEQWYSDTLAAFAQKGNRWNSIPALTYSAARLDIPVAQVIDDAHALGIHNRDSDIRRGMATALAKMPSRLSRYAYRLHVRRQEPPRPQPITDFVRRMVDTGGDRTTLHDLQRLSPYMIIDPYGIEWLPEQQTDLWLTTLYRPGDHLHIFDNSRHVKAELEHDVRTLDEWRTLDGIPPIHPNDGNPCFDCRPRHLDWWKRCDCMGRNPLTGKTGVTAGGDPSCTAANCIAAFRYVLIEFDHLPLHSQCAFWRGFVSDPERAAAVASLVFSGNKSIHGLLRVPSDVDADTYSRNLKALLCADSDATYHADPNGFRPHGGTRIAGAKRRDNGNLQRLVYLNP